MAVATAAGVMPVSGTVGADDLRPASQLDDDLLTADVAAADDSAPEPEVTSRSGITPLVPARLVDTRSPESTIDGEQSGDGIQPADHDYVIDVAGRGGVPSSGAAAVMLNVTVVRPSSPGYATVYPAASERPLAANLNHGLSTAVANQVLVQLDDKGQVAVYHRAETHLVVDVVGWLDAEGDAPTLVPARLLDTRSGQDTVDGRMSGIGRVGSDRSVPVTVLGRGGVPLTGAGSVVISVTAVNPTANGFLTVYPDGTDRPNAASLNYVAGSSIANQVVTGLGDNGRFAVYASSATDVVVDVVGWLPDDSDLATLTPSRLLDTRPDGETVDGNQAGEGILHGGTVIDIDVGGRAGVSGIAGSVILNVAAVRPSSAGYLTVYPAQDELPEASSLNYAPGQNIANQVLVQLGDDEQVRVYSPVDTHVVVDVVAWLPPGVNQMSSDVVVLTDGGEQIELASGGPGTGAATFPMPDGEELEVGEVAVLVDASGAPFYGRVSSIDGAMVTAAEVTLGEVIPAGSYDFVADAETGIIDSDSFGVVQTPQQINAAASFAVNSVGVSAGNTTIDCSDGDVDFDFSFNGLSFDGSADWGAFYITAEAYYTPSISIEAKGTIPDGGSCTITQTVASRTLPPINFSIGPVPVQIQHDVKLEVEAVASADGDMEITAGATASAKIGARYDGGLSAINEFDLDRRFDLGTKGEATFEVALVASYSASLYGVVGFSAWIRPSVKAVINPALQKWIVVTAQVDVGLTATLTFEFDLAITSIGFSEEFELARKTIWGPREIYSRNRADTLPMTSTVPAEIVQGKPFTGTVSIPSGVPAGSKVTWSTEGLPAGLTLTPNGNSATISGTATSTTPISFLVDADVLPPGKLALNRYSDKVINITVVPKLAPGVPTTGIGEVGQSFEGTVLAVGGKAPYTWSATGLPAGVTLGATTTNTPVNTLIGVTPTASTGTVKVTVSDSSVNDDIVVSVPWSVVPAVNLPDVTFPPGDVGQVYSQSIVIADGTDEVTHRVSGIPYGLDVIRSGRTITVAGTPLVSGPQAYRVDVKSRLGNKADTTRYFPVRPPLVLDTTAVTVPVGSAEMQPGDGWIDVVGGTGPFTWTVDDLPPGVTFDTDQTGRRVRVVGSQPTASVLSFDVSVSDSIGSTPATGSLALRSVEGASFTSTDLPTGALGGVYDGRVEVSGGRAPYDLKAVGLPVGVSVTGDGDSGFDLTGTPTLAGNYRVTLELSDASGRPAVRQTVPVTINEALTLTAGTMPNAVSGSTYAGATFAVTGGVAPYEWDVTGLPDGLSLLGDPTGPTLVVGGSPAAAGAANVSISVTDAAGSPAATDTRSFTVTAPLAIDTTGAPTKAYTDVAATGTITSTGGNLPVTFSATNLPTGMALSATGVISGMPESGDGTVTVTYIVTDNDGYTAQNTVDLRVIPALAVDLSSTRTALATGNLYDGSVSATGGVAPYSYSIAMKNADPLPDFIELAAATGTFTSTNVATQSGTYELTVTVTDSDGAGRSKSADYTLNVAETEPITVTVNAPSFGTNGTAISGTSSATGGISPYTWSLVGAPTWLSIDESTGALSGTPTGENGAVTFTVSADGGIFNGTKSVTIDVRPPLSVDASGIPLTGSAGTNYTGSFTWSGGRTPTVEVTGLPTTLTATTTTSPGSISGRPLTGGSHTVTVTATDPDGRTASATRTVVIAAAATLAIDASGMPTEPSLTDPEATYSGTATVSGGVTPYTWSAASGLPAGVTMTTSGNTATFSGRPASSGTYTVGLEVTDLAGVKATKSVTLEIALEPLAVSISELWSIGHNGVTESLGAVTASGGKAPYTFSSGTMPDGLAINAATGVISGTATEVAAATNVTITVTDANEATASATWSIEIKDPVVITKPDVPTELSATAFVPIKLPSMTGTPTFSTLARYPGGSSTSMFTCSLYTTGQWGCFGEARTLVGGNWVYHPTITLDIFVTEGARHGAVRVPLTFTTQSITDISMGRDHGCAVYADTTMKCWGGNGQGQLGHAFSTPTAVSTEPVYVTDSSGVPITGWVSVEASANAPAGKEFTCALKKVAADGVDNPSYYDVLDWERSAWCWGYGLDGQLGNGAGASSPTPVRVSEEGRTGMYRYDAYDLVVGGEKACAQTIAGVTGSQNYAAGPVTNTAILSSHCWGKRATSAGDSLWAKQPTNQLQNLVDISYDRFGDNYAMGGAHDCIRLNADLYSTTRIECYGPSAVTGGSGQVEAGFQLYLDAPQKVAAGRAHTCALLGGIENSGTNTTTLATGEIRCWGDNSNLQIGSTSTATNVAQATGGPTGEYYRVSPTSIYSMDAGGDTTCANTAYVSGPPAVAVKINCWGRHYAGDTAGTVATITIPDSSRLKTVGATAACAQSSSGLAYWCWGSHTNGQTGLGTNSLNGGTTVAYPANV